MILFMDRDNSVGKATCYRLDGSGVESRWGRDFPHPSRPVLGPTQPPIQSGRGMALTTHPHLLSRLKKEWVYNSTLLLGLRGLFWGEIYLYFTSMTLIIYIRHYCGLTCLMTCRRR